MDKEAEESKTYIDAFIYQRPKVKVTRFFVEEKDGTKKHDYSTIEVEYQTGKVTFFIHNFTVEEFKNIIEEAIKYAKDNVWKGEIK
jgi:hypothetical protein